MHQSYDAPARPRVFRGVRHATGDRNPSTTRSKATHQHDVAVAMRRKPFGTCSSCHSYGTQLDAVRLCARCAAVP